jgi:hypothetical protein
VHDPRLSERPSLLDRATPPLTPLEAARLDEALRSDRPPPIGVIVRAYGIGDWSQLTVRGVVRGR